MNVIAGAPIPAAEVRAAARLVEGGYEMQAMIPWSLLGTDGPPRGEGIDMQLIMDMTRPGGEALQLELFEALCRGWALRSGRVSVD